MTRVCGPRGQPSTMCQKVTGNGFRKDGSKMRSGYFQSGKQTGKWTTYDKDGVTVKVTDFDRKTKRSKSAIKNSTEGSC